MNLQLASGSWLLAASTDSVIADLIRNLLNVGSCHRPLAIGLKIRGKITHFLISSNLQRDKSFLIV